MNIHMYELHSISIHDSICLKLMFSMVLSLMVLMFLMLFFSMLLFSFVTMPPLILHAYKFQYFFSRLKFFWNRWAFFSFLLMIKLLHLVVLILHLFSLYFLIIILIFPMHITLHMFLCPWVGFPSTLKIIYPSHPRYELRSKIIMSREKFKTNAL
jgi:hypothetical protein